jgi:hypothetical protein
MLEQIKMALRITTNAYDAELNNLIAAAAIDLGIAGVNEARESVNNPIIIRAVSTYCKMNFGTVDDYDRLKASYDEQKAQLSMATGYTDWSDGLC